MFMIHEKIKKHGPGPTDQPCFYFIKEGFVIDRSFGCLGKSIWGVQGTGIPLRTDGQKEPGFHPNSRSVVFTVKLGPSLIKRVKATASSMGLSISTVVKMALEEFLSKPARGKKRETS